MANAARAPKIIEMPLKRQPDTPESFVPASLPSESPAAIAARKLEALAHFHLALEEYAEALEAFRRLLKLVPSRPDLLVQTVACMERLERWEEGAALLQPEVEQHPDWTEAALALGICRLHINQPADALEVFKAVEARLPGNSVAREGIRAAQALLGPAAAPDRPVDWEVQLYDLAEGREWERLVKACEPYVAQGEPSAHFYSAYALEQMGNLEFAIADYERCLEGSPSHREARYNLSCLLIQLEQYSRATHHLAKLTSIDSENSNAWWNYMLAAELSGEYEEAFHAAQRLIQLDGYTPELRFRLGLCCLQSARYEEAARQFDLCLESNEYWTEARINLGLAKQRMGNFDQARAILENSLREQPSSVDAAEALVALELELGQLEAAVSTLETLQARGIALAGMAFRIAGAFEARNEIPAALHYYERALRAEPGHAHALLSLAQLFERQGNEGKAQNCRLLALKLNPAVAATYFGGGEC
jgi:tetratricopeptide (TPR) repeat protein